MIIKKKDYVLKDSIPSPYGDLFLAKVEVDFEKITFEDAKANILKASSDIIQNTPYLMICKPYDDKDEPFYIDSVELLCSLYHMEDAEDVKTVIGYISTSKYVRYIFDVVDENRRFVMMPIINSTFTTEEEINTMVFETFKSLVRSMTMYSNTKMLNELPLKLSKILREAICYDEDMKMKSLSIYDLEEIFNRVKRNLTIK